MDINFELRSGKSFEETAAALEENLKGEGFGVLWQFNIQDKLREKGHPIDENYLVYEICNPEKAKTALATNQDAAYFLPCKVVVMEKAGEVRVGMIRPTLMIEMLGDSELHDIAHDVERHLKRAIMESV